MLNGRVSAAVLAPGDLDAENVISVAGAGSAVAMDAVVRASAGPATGAIEMAPTGPCAVTGVWSLSVRSEKLPVRFWSASAWRLARARAFAVARTVIREVSGGMRC